MHLQMNHSPSLSSHHDEKDGLPEEPDQEVLVGGPLTEDGESFDRVPQQNRRMGAASAVMLIVNRMVGTGIFATPASILASTGSIGLALFLWIVGGIITAAGLAVYLEWGTGLPRSGGEKNYLEFSFRKPRYFITCIYATYMALLGLSSSNCVFAGEMLLNAANVEVNQWNQRGIGLGIVTFAFLIHGVTPKFGIYLSNALGLFKIVVLLFTICTGFAALAGHVPGGAPKNYEDAFAGIKTDTNAFVSALYSIIYSFNGYSNVFYAMSEIHNPIPTVKRAAPFAMILITVLYILVNVAYFAAVPKETALTSNRLLAAEFFGIMFGRKADRAVSVFIALSAIGSVLAVLFGLGRVNQELGREGVLPFSKFWASNKPFNSPFAGLGLQWFANVVIILAPPPGDAYTFMLNLVSYPQNIFNTLICIGLLWVYFHRSEYDWNPPVKASWPVVVFFLLSNLFLLAAPLIPPSGSGPYKMIPYWLHVAVAFGLGGLGVLYWVIWTVVLPKIGHYKLVRQREIASDGLTRNVFKKVSLSEYSQ